jgi:hypothetical protein
VAKDPAPEAAWLSRRAKSGKRHQRFSPGSHPQEATVRVRLAPLTLAVRKRRRDGAASRADLRPNGTQGSFEQMLRCSGGHGDDDGCFVSGKDWRKESRCRRLPGMGVVWSASDLRPIL